MDGFPVPPACRTVLGKLLGGLVAAALKGMEDWKAGVRKSAAGQLRSTIVMAQDLVLRHVPELFGGLCRSSQDDEAEVRALVKDCAALMGRFVEPAAQLAVLLPQARGAVSGLAGPEHRAASLAILAGTIAGTPRDLLLPHLADVCSTLADPACYDVELPQLRREAVACLDSVVRVAGVACGGPDVSIHVCVSLLQLLAADSDASVVEAATRVAGTLSLALGAPNLNDLFASNARAIVGAFAASHGEWTKHSPGRAGFDALLRHYPGCVVGALAPVTDIFLATLEPSRDPDLRIAMLALLDSFLSAQAGPGTAPGSGEEGSGPVYSVPAAALTPFLAHLVVQGLGPNIEWRVGRVAATIRKVAIACLFTGLRRGALEEGGLRAVARAVLPTLKTCLGDDDAATRHVTCLVLSRLFKSLPGYFDAMGVRDVYFDLAKRLDDSNDQVRIAACTMLKSFAGTASPGDMRGGPVEYIVDCLLVHLDDTDRAIQEAALGALVAFGKVDLAYTLRSAAEAKTKHRVTEFVDRLVKALEG